MLVAQSNITREREREIRCWTQNAAGMIMIFKEMGQNLYIYKMLLYGIEASQVVAGHVLGT